MIRQHGSTDANKLGDVQVYTAQLIEQVTHMMVDDALHRGEVYLHVGAGVESKKRTILP